MMIDVTVADVDLNLAQLYTRMNPLVAGAQMLWHAGDRLVFGTGPDRFVITGTDLTWRDGALQGGAVEALTFRSHGVDLIRFAALQTTGAVLWSALLAEQAGTDPAALTHLLVRHCWTYHGSTGVDYFPETTLPPFGALDPTGNDKVYLNAGDDTFFAGGAQDTVFGAAGDDLVRGGTDDDLLIGGAGGDSLEGGSGGDRLYGGRGGDVLTGGSGDDFLSGGPGDDRMRGGFGADVFAFDRASGQDVVADYRVGVDHLQIMPGLPVEIVDLAGGARVQFGLSSVLLVGISADQVSPADFL